MVCISLVFSRSFVERSFSIRFVALSILHFQGLWISGLESLRSPHGQALSVELNLLIHGRRLPLAISQRHVLRLDIRRSYSGPIFQGCGRFLRLSHLQSIFYCASDIPPPQSFSSTSTRLLDYDTIIRNANVFTTLLIHTFSIPT